MLGTCIGASCLLGGAVLARCSCGVMACGRPPPAGNEAMGARGNEEASAPTSAAFMRSVGALHSALPPRSCFLAKKWSAAVLLGTRFFGFPNLPSL